MAFTDRELENLDPLRLDREIARAATAVRGWRRRLKWDDGIAHDPFWAFRSVSGRAAFRAVDNLPAYDPLRASLRSWVYWLADQRVNRAAMAKVAVERYRTEHVVPAPERARLPLSTVLDRALTEPVRREEWLDTFVKASGPLGDAVTLLWERRQEVAVRMDLSSPDAIESPTPDIYVAASAWLDQTRDLFDGTESRSLVRLFRTGLAESATEGWPRHLLPRTLLDLFRDTDLFRSVNLDPGELPELRAPTSFLRALARVGAAWVDATAPGDQPFVIAHDPYGLRRRTFGALLATLPGTVAFAKRPLEIPTARMADHRRIFGAALLVESRTAALRVVLRSAALAGRSAFKEAFTNEMERTFGFVLPSHAKGALFRLNADDPQRFAGLLLSAGHAVQLREDHNEDWHRNPRAVEQLRDEARRAPERTTTKAALEQGAHALHERIVRALG